MSEDHEIPKREAEPTEEEVGRIWPKLALRKLLRYSIAGSGAWLLYELFSGARIGFSDLFFSLLVCTVLVAVVIPVFLVLSIPLLDRECRETWSWKIQKEWKDWKCDLVSEHNRRLRKRHVRELAWRTARESRVQTDGSRAGGPGADRVQSDSPDFGEDNVIFTGERAEAARARIVSRLGINETRGTSEGERIPDGERQPSPLEKRLMLALELPDVRELDKLLEKPLARGLELENIPPTVECDGPPNQDELETVDGHDFDVYASMRERFEAYICDFAVVFSAVSLLIVGVRGLEKPALSGTLILIAYMVLAQWIWHTTIGKYVFGLEIRSVTRNRRYPSLWALVTRETGGRIASTLLFGAGYWSAMGRPQHQAWSDRIAGTIIVRHPTTTRITRVLKVLVVISLLIVICLDAAYVYSLISRF